MTDLWWLLAVPAALAADWALGADWTELLKQTCPICREDCAGTGEYARHASTCVKHPGLRFSRD